MTRYLRRKNRHGVPMARVPAPTGGLRMHRETRATLGRKIVTLWTAYYDGALIGEWDGYLCWVAHGRGANTHHIYLRAWRAAARAEAERLAGVATAEAMA